MCVWVRLCVSQWGVCVCVWVCVSQWGLCVCVSKVCVCESQWGLCVCQQGLCVCVSMRSVCVSARSVCVRVCLSEVCVYVSARSVCVCVCVCRDERAVGWESAAAWRAHLPCVHGRVCERGVPAVWTSCLLWTMRAGATQLRCVPCPHPRHCPSLPQLINSLLLLHWLLLPILWLLLLLLVNEARDDGGLGWQWHQLDHMQTICISLQTDNHTNTSSLGLPQMTCPIIDSVHHWLNRKWLLVILCSRTRHH